MEAVNLTAQASGENRPGSVAMPGDVLEYRLVFTNRTEGPVRNIVFTNPIPEGTRYIGGTADADRTNVQVEFSIDEGASYSTSPMIVVVEAGEQVRRPAPPEMYTHMRWTVRDSVPVREQVTAHYRLRVQPRSGESS